MISRGGRKFLARNAFCWDSRRVTMTRPGWITVCSQLSARGPEMGRRRIYQKTFAILMGSTYSESRVEGRACASLKCSSMSPRARSSESKWAVLGYLFVFSRWARAQMVVEEHTFHLLAVQVSARAFDMMKGSLTEYTHRKPSAVGRRLRDAA